MRESSLSESDGWPSSRRHSNGDLRAGRPGGRPAAWRAAPPPTRAAYPPRSYEPRLARGNPWFQGPFHYVESQREQDAKAHRPTPFRCPMPGCALAFAQAAELVSHFERHLDD